jgi:Mce-associated membrane protein
MTPTWLQRRTTPPTEPAGAPEPERTGAEAAGAAPTGPGALEAEAGGVGAGAAGHAAVEPGAVGPEVAGVGAVEPEAAEARAAGVVPTAPETAVPGAPEAESAASGAGAPEPERAGVEAAGAALTDPETAKPGVAGAGAVGPEVAGARAASATPTEPGAAVPGAPEAEAAEPEAAEAEAPEPGVAEPEPEAAGPGAPEGEDPAPRLPGGRLWKAALVGTAVVLVLGGCGFLYGAHELRSQAPARNQALTDTAATTRVAGDVGNALARIFSYTPDGTAAAERSARTVLDGRAARQYETLLARVRDDLADQRVTLSTRAVRTGVIELDGDRARLLVFLDQTSQRAPGKGKDKGADKAEHTTAAAQLTVTARLDDDRWRIVDIKAR